MVARHAELDAGGQTGASAGRCYDAPAMNRTARKLLVAMMLALCIGIHVFEVSGRWDRTFADASDEAAIVAVVLCIGMAISVAGTVLNRLLARTMCRLLSAPSLGSVRLPAFQCALPVSLTGPPFVPLRI
jgi:hypothetical protein